MAGLVRVLCSEQTAASPPSCREIRAISQQHSIADCDNAFAHKAMIRAYAVAEDSAQCEMHIQLARKVGWQVEKEEGRNLFLSELETISGYE